MGLLLMSLSAIDHLWQYLWAFQFYDTGFLSNGPSFPIWMAASMRSNPEWNDAPEANNV